MPLTPYDNADGETPYEKYLSYTQVNKKKKFQVAYSENDIDKFIKDYEVAWCEENAINTLQFQPKKRSLTPYMLFASNQRKFLPNSGMGVRVSDTMRQIGADWNNLADADKAKFKDLSIYLIEKYCSG